MKRWSKTTITWKMFSGFFTDVPITDWPEDSPHKNPGYHQITAMKITSLPAREAELKVRILRGVISPKGHQLTAIRRRLLSFGQSDLREASLKYNDMTPDFTLRFSLHKGEKFCDAAMTAANYVARHFLGLYDDARDYKELHFCRFNVSQETFFWHKGEWISFARYLCIKYSLPTLPTSRHHPA
ncbi:hypothetical protein K8R42_04370 [bacterium]|nr:hypothetical protein [bacterium]